MNWMAVGLGGALGSIARHGLNQLIQQRGLAQTFPLGIFVINVTGSLAIGLLAGLMAGSRLSLPDVWRAFLFAGFLGGFTTFSAFSLDTLTLARGGHVGLAAANAAGQVVLSVLAAWAGFRLAAYWPGV